MNVGEVRIALECAVAARASERATDEQRARLRELRETADLDPTGPEADARFQGARDIHTLLAEAAANPVLTAQVVSVNQELLLPRLRNKSETLSWD